MSGPTIDGPTVSAAGASRVVEAAVRRAEELGVAVVVWVVDPGGHDVAMLRMDGAPLLSRQVARDKAWSSVAFGQPTTWWATIIDDDPLHPRVTVLPITRAPPAEPTAAVEIPSPTKRRLGLDDDRSWIVLSEANEFRWPGPDLRPLPGGDASTVVYGMLPPDLFRIVRQRVAARVRAGRMSRVRRTE